MMEVVKFLECNMDKDSLLDQSLLRLLLLGPSVHFLIKLSVSKSPARLVYLESSILHV